MDFLYQLTFSSSVFIILILLEGSTEITAENVKHTFNKPNSVCCFFLSGQYLSVTHTKNQELKGMIFLYLTEMILSILFFYPLLGDIRESVEKKKQIISEANPVTAVTMEKLYQITHTPFLPSMEEFYHRTITGIAQLLFSELSEKPSDTSLRMYDISGIHRAMDYVNEHLSARITINQIARKAGINELKLKSGFKEIYGMGVHAYIIHQRLEAARKALELTRLPLKQISIQACYKSLSNFCTAFKKQFGETPGQIRNLKRKP